ACEQLGPGRDANGPKGSRSDGFRFDAHLPAESRGEAARRATRRRYGSAARIGAASQRRHADCSVLPQLLALGVRWPGLWQLLRKLLRSLRFLRSVFALV